jgi:hypothetical protein
MFSLLGGTPHNCRIEYIILGWCSFKEEKNIVYNLGIHFLVARFFGVKVLAFLKQPVKRASQVFVFLFLSHAASVLTGHQQCRALSW